MVHRRGLRGGCAIWRDEAVGFAAEGVGRLKRPCAWELCEARGGGTEGG